MRVALLIDSLHGGGSEGVVRRLAIGLAGRGHGVFVICLKRADLPVEELDELAAAGVTLREACSRGRDFLLFRRLTRWLREDRVELVHAHSCAALVSVFPGARRLGLPLIHVRHGRPQNGANRYVWLADRLTPWIDRLVINCSALRACLPRGRAEDAIHIPNGVDVEPTSPGEARRTLDELCGRTLSRPLILSVANLRPEKDILNLLRAFAELRQSFGEATLVCIGSSPDRAYRAAIGAECERLGVWQSAIFPGPTRAAAGLMPAADVLCLSSENDAMPNVILEAMAQGVPIVATAVGDVGRLDPRRSDGSCMLEHGGTALLAPVGDSGALAAALRATLEDPCATAKRAERAKREHALRFTTARMVERYEALYVDCLTHQKGRRVSSRTVVLMVGPAAPQLGGMVSSIDTLMESPLASEFALHRFATVVPRARNAASRATTASRVFGAVMDAGSLVRAALRHVERLLALGVTLVRRRIDIVHIHTCSFGTFYRSLADMVVARLFGRKVIVHVRGGQFAAFCGTRSALGRWLIRWGTESADRVIFLGGAIADDVRPFLGRARVVVVPNGVAIETPIPSGERQLETGATTSAPCRFLFLGELSVAKGVPDLLRAAEVLCQADTSFELLVAGPASSAAAGAEYCRQVSESELATRVRFIGPVDRDRRRDLFRTVDCLVHPSRSEAMPNTILEAAAAGLPVIATAVGCVPEMFAAKARPETEGACWAAISPLVRPSDPIGLSQAMSRLAGEPALRRSIGEALRRRVIEEYSDVRLAERMSEIYRSVLAERAEGRQRPTQARSAASQDLPVSPVGRLR